MQGGQLLLAGKLGGRAVCAIQPGRLIHLCDQLTDELFLVDTGASYSILPYTSSASPSGPSLSGAGGRKISCWGERRRTLLFGGQEVSWTFLLADVRCPILGIDFIKHFRLLVDPAGGQLLFKDGRRRWPVLFSGPSSSSFEGACAGPIGPNSTAPGSSPVPGRLFSVQDVLTECPERRRPSTASDSQGDPSSCHLWPAGDGQVPPVRQCQAGGREG